MCDSAVGYAIVDSGSDSTPRSGLSARGRLWKIPVGTNHWVARRSSDFYLDCHWLLEAIKMWSPYNHSSIFSVSKAICFAATQDSRPFAPRCVPARIDGLATIYLEGLKLTVVLDTHLV
jgi:hypothetical protein